MQKGMIIESLEALKARKLKSCVVLYSGGTDGSYFLQWAKEQDIDILALNIGLEDSVDHSWSAQVAETLGVPYVFQNRTEEFVNNYISPGIMANSYYQGLYPICSSLSRPLMAKAGVDLARQKGIEAIAHTSTYMQNSAARFNLSIMALDPELYIVAPFLSSQITREEKQRQLRSAGITFSTNIYSIDQNIWGRVIECGTLENPENDLPESGVFEWTRDINSAPGEPELVEIEFEEGLPLRLNGKRCNLFEMLRELNLVGGRHGVGRFSGLEDIPFGAKNHEIREAPAAHILITAHRELESAILSQSELSLKQFLDNYWVNLVVSGFWYSELKEAISAFITRLNKLVSGKVKIKLHRGNLIVLSKKAESGLYYAKFQEEFASLMKNVAFSPLYTTMGLPMLRRRGR